MSDLRLAALRGIVWSAVQQIGDNGLRLPVYLVLARLLSPEAFGLVALAIAYVEFLQLLRNQGVSMALVQRERLEPDHLDSAFWGGIVLGLLMGMAAFVTAGPFARVTGQPGLEPIVRWLSIAFVVGALSSVQDAILRRELRFQALAIRTLIAQAAAGLAAIAAALAGLGIWSLVVMSLVQQVGSCLVLWRASPWRPGLRFSWDRYRELLTFGVSMMGVQLIRFVRMRADNFLIGVGLGPTALGYYSVARQFVNGITALVTGSIGPVLWPTLARLQDEPRRLARAIYQSAEMLALVAFPVFLGAAAVSVGITPLVLGERWAASAPIFAALAVAEMVRSPVGLNLMAMAAVGQTGWRVGLEIMTATVTLIALMLALQWGVVAVAWAWAIPQILLLPIQLRLAFRLLELDPRAFLDGYRSPLMGSLLMLGSVLGVRAALGEIEGLVNLATAVLAGAAAYSGFMWWAAPDATRRALENLRVALRGVFRAGEDA
ncbi:MAG: lipopolysaccharide biosynthesis protein [Gemmatimonadota bacterium]